MLTSGELGEDTVRGDALPYAFSLAFERYLMILSTCGVALIVVKCY